MGALQWNDILSSGPALVRVDYRRAAWQPEIQYPGHL
jgi:hypothetical protein